MVKGTRPDSIFVAGGRARRILNYSLQWRPSRFTALNRDSSRHKLDLGGAWVAPLQLIKYREETTWYVKSSRHSSLIYIIYTDTSYNMYTH